MTREGSLVRRRLTIRTKLAATLAVPLAALASFAALQMRDAYNRSEQVRLQAGLATSATGPAGVLNALENERDYEALRAIGAQNLVAEENAKFSAQVTATTEVALADAQRLADRQAQGDADLRVRADGPFEHAVTGALDAPARKKAVAELQASARDPLHANLLTLLKIRPDSINLLRVAQTNTAS